MPVGPTKTKAQKQHVVKTEMHKFGQGNLHSGSKSGPVVTNPKQAVAISLSESGQSKAPPAKGKAPSRGKGESKPGYDRSGHFPGNPGFPTGKGEKNMSKKPMANVGSEKRGSSLNEQASVGHAKQPQGSMGGKGKAIHGSSLESNDGVGHAKQPGGTSIGAGAMGGAEHHKGHSMGGEAHSFQPPPMGSAHSFGHSGHQKSGSMRLSGHSGAHRIGHKSK